MKKYYATLGGVRWEISPERAAQIKRLQKLIADQRERDTKRLINPEQYKDLFTALDGLNTEPDNNIEP